MAKPGAPEEQPEWLLKCLKEVKEELRSELMESMSESTLRLKLRQKPAAFDQLADAIRSGEVSLNPGSSKRRHKAKSHVRRELSAYELHCLRPECEVPHGLAAQADGPHPLVALPKRMDEDEKRRLLTDLIGRMDSRAASSVASEPRTDLWSTVDDARDSTDDDDFSLVAESDHCGSELGADYELVGSEDKDEVDVRVEEVAETEEEQTESAGQPPSVFQLPGDMSLLDVDDVPKTPHSTPTEPLSRAPESVVVLEAKEEPATLPPALEALYRSLLKNKEGQETETGDVFHSLRAAEAAEETELKRPIFPVPAEPKPEPRITHSTSKEALAAVVGGAMKVAEAAVETAGRVIGSTSDALKATGRRFEPPKNNWTPKAPAWVPQGTQTWTPPEPWTPQDARLRGHSQTQDGDAGTQVQSELGETALDGRQTEAMDILIGMGFTDVEKNLALLRIHGNNLNSIVDTLLTDFQL